MLSYLKSILRATTKTVARAHQFTFNFTKASTEDDYFTLTSSENSATYNRLMSSIKQGQFGLQPSPLGSTAQTLATFCTDNINAPLYLTGDHALSANDTELHDFINHAERACGISTTTERIMEFYPIIFISVAIAFLALTKAFCRCKNKKNNTLLTETGPDHQSIDISTEVNYTRMTDDENLDQLLHDLAVDPDNDPLFHSAARGVVISKNSR